MLTPREAATLLIGLVLVYLLWWAAGALEPTPEPIPAQPAPVEITGWCERDGVRVAAVEGVCSWES